MTGIVIATSGVLLQLLMLFGRPAYRFIRAERKGFRFFLSIVILIRLLWAALAYQSIWNEFNHPEQWPLDLPGSALIAYVAIFPILILAFDWLLLVLLAYLVKLFNSKFDTDGQGRRST